ncbi:hypothetical protein C2G38_2053585 [Gigaspora rosea]|uniref:Uncharacterized protein n=1 Tax=Gigaspora rosea TaxID=44941 RepID=A0A397W748_9GLOM|nr:hypothetical protein C2G38_2053585 [Gigaspora rosea]
MMACISSTGISVVAFVTSLISVIASITGKIIHFDCSFLDRNSDIKYSFSLLIFKNSPSKRFISSSFNGIVLARIIVFGLKLCVDVGRTEF